MKLQQPLRDRARGLRGPGLTSADRSEIDAAKNAAETAAGLSSSASVIALAARDVTLLYNDATETANNAVQTAALQVAADRAQVASDKGQVASDRAAVQSALGQAQAISFASAIDSRKNLVIGTDGAVAPGGAVTDGSISLGVGAGAGTDQTYSRKFNGYGYYVGIGWRGYASNLNGAYTGARGISDFGNGFGTHALQDANAIGAIIEGYGVRATGFVSFLAQATIGRTYTVNGVALTVAAAPATAYEFAPGASAAESAASLLRCLLALTDAAILNGYYRLDAPGATVLNIASASRGTYGNGFTLATNDPAAAASGATLTGGADVVNNGLPASSSGDNGMGFGAGGFTHHMQPRKASARAAMASLPADGDIIRLGFNLAKTITIKNAPTTALDVQRGATVADQLANLVATLNGSADTTIDDVTYWAQAGQLFIEHDSNNVTTFECMSSTAAIVFDARNLRFGGAPSNTGGNNSLGHNCLLSSVAVGAFSSGSGAGSYSTGAHRTTMGRNAASVSNGSDWFVVGQNALAYCEGDDAISIGARQSTGSQDAWLPITAVSLAGIITFAAPHGWRQGHNYAIAYRDRTAGGSTIQSRSAGTGTWANLGAGLGSIFVVAINAMQVKILQGLPNADTGAPGFEYRANGAVTNMDVSRYTRDVTRSITLGSDATVRPYTISLGSRYYVGGIQIDANGLYIANGDLRLPLVIPGAFANGNLRFPTALADGDTITVSDSTGSFTMTAKSAANMAAVTNGMDRWFQIDASPLQTMRNFILALATNDDQSTARKIAGRVRFRAGAVGAMGIYLYWQLLDTGGSDFAISTSKGDAVATVSSAGTIGNLPTPTSLNPPNDTGMVMLTSSPAANGQPGPAQYNATRGWWSCHRNAA